MRGIIVSTVFACLFWPQLLLAALPEGLAGQWRGVVEIDGVEAAVGATLVERGDGFDLALSLPGTPALQVRFVPSQQPRVFEVAAASRGLFGFFDGSDSSTPFDGAPLIWARESGLGIVAYRLVIAPDGGMALLRVALEPVEAGVQLQLERRIDARPAQRFVVMLEPAS
jgi:hypothetical protein